MLLVGVGFLALGTGYLLAHAGVVVPEGVQSLIGSQFAGMTLASPFWRCSSARARWPRMWGCR